MLHVPRRKMCGNRKTIGSCPNDRDGDSAHDSSLAAMRFVFEERGVERKNLGTDLSPRYISESAWTIPGIGSPLSAEKSTARAACFVIQDRQYARSSSDILPVRVCAKSIERSVKRSKNATSSPSSACALVTASCSASVSPAASRHAKSGSAAPRRISNPI